MLYNKTMDYEDMSQLFVNPVVLEMKEMVDKFRELDLIVTATGRLNRSNFNEYKYSNTLHTMRAWEYSRVFQITNMQAGNKLLDCGGASSPLVFYMALKGIDMTSIDLQESLVENTNVVARRLGLHNLRAEVRNMLSLPFEDESFDYAVCISVLEHMNDEAKKRALIEMARVVKPGGIVALTFDYGEGIGVPASYDINQPNELHSPIKNLEDIKRLIIEPSGLQVYGNEELYEKRPFEVDENLIREYELYNIRAARDFDMNRYMRVLDYKSYFTTPYTNYTAFSLFLKKPC